ncbi:MAG: VCBS repeat-containing protein [Archangium sp.]|nr:VCBS repeat-containing protein [Archangium sp.]
MRSHLGTAAALLLGLSCAEAGGCAPPLNHFISAPKTDRPWVGAVMVRPQSPVGAWKVDGVDMPLPPGLNPELMLDTRSFPDGEHTLSLEWTVEGAERRASGKVTFANGPAASPVLSGAFVDLAPGIAIAAPFMPSAQDFRGAIAGDFDGDSDLDLFTWTPSAGVAQFFLQTAPLVFTPSGPRLNLVVNTAGLGDLDGDGLPDLVTGGFELHVFKNTGGVFTDVTQAAGVAEPRGPLRDYQGITMADLDNDGLLDFAVARLDCSGDTSPNRVLRNEGDFHFADIGPALGLDLPLANTFAFAIDRIGTDGALHVWPFQDSCQRGPLGKHYRFVDGPDLPVLLDADEPVENLGPMGSAVLDVDGDGLLDEFIAGCFSSPAWTAPRFAESASPFVGLDAFPDPSGDFITAWSMATLDADLDGLPDVYVTHHPSNPGGNVEGSRDALFWQRSKGHFSDIAPEAGLTGYQPCRGVQVTDLDQDGDPDLLVGCHRAVRVLRNDLVVPGVGRTVVLHGTLSNADGVNALLTSPGGEQRLVRGGGNPYAGGVTRESLRAPTGMLEIAWPSGLVQRVDVGTAPVLEVTEPAVVRVTPRRVAAGTSAPVQVEVTPAALGDSAAAVSVLVSAGTFTTPMHQDPDGVWRGTLATPAEISTVVIEVTVGSQKLAVRPRVFVR